MSTTARPAPPADTSPPAVPAGAAHEWRVTGMDCGACVAKVRGAVERLPGVHDVDVTLVSERLRVTLDDDASRDTAPIEAAIRALGYGIEAVSAPAAETRWYASGKGRLVLGTGALLVAAWVAKLLGPEVVATWAFGVATLAGLAPVARRAFASARARMPFTIEMLMTIASVGAVVIGAVEEAALVVFLFAVGELLEGVATSRARESIRGLTQLVPRTALVESPDGTVQEVAADAVSVGQVVLVRPGARVPADGDVVAGTSGVDESPVTGESAPVAKRPGDAVFAGSVNAEAALHVRVTRAAADHTIARIVRLVEEAELSRADTERFITRFSRVYMPVIVCTALLVGVVPPVLAGQPWETWIYRALALLLIGCPCALVISVPASIAAALSAGARHGLLLKGGVVVEAAARTRVVAFDKTGTLTNGTPVVTDVVPIGTSEAELLTLAAAVESASSHPVAGAIRDRAAAGGVPAAAVRDAAVIPGRGARGLVDGREVTVGSVRLADEAGVLVDATRDRAAALAADGKTVVAVLSGGELLGLLALRDEAREDAAAGVARLRSLGVDAVMLTGDNPRTAAAIADGLGIAHRAGLLPEDKLAAVRELAAERDVMMVGDGINDAPALAAAQVGVAMGSGTDAALETADAAILRNRVGDVAATIALARTAMARVRQNVGIALGLKAVFLVTSVLGVTGLWMAILADTGATVLVTLNALRLLGFRADRAD